MGLSYLESSRLTVDQAEVQVVLPPQLAELFTRETGGDMLPMHRHMVSRPHHEGWVDWVHHLDVNLVLVPEVEVGEHVIVHSGYAIRVVDSSELERLQELYV